MILLGAKHHTIDASKLVKADCHYNPSLIRWQGQLLLLYRYQHRIFPRIPEAPHHHVGPSHLAIAKLNERFEPIENIALALPDHAEDGRFFPYQGRLYISYGGENVQKIARLDKNLQVEHWQPLPTKVDCEKNWVFFPHSTVVYSIYRYQPDFQIWQWNPDFTVAKVHEQRYKFDWKWGQIRGGTPPIHTGGGYHTTFFHSSYFYKHSKAFEYKIYVMGRILFDDNWQIMRVSTEPLLEPSFEKHVGLTTSAVVFPAGAVYENRQWKISYGKHDLSSHIMVVDEEELKAVEGF